MWRGNEGDRGSRYSRLQGYYAGYVEAGREAGRRILGVQDDSRFGAFGLESLGTCQEICKVIVSAVVGSEFGYIMLVPGLDRGLGLHAGVALIESLVNCISARCFSVSGCGAPMLCTMLDAKVAPAWCDNADLSYE